VFGAVGVGIPLARGEFGEGAPVGLPGVIVPPGPFTEGAWGETRGLTFGEFPMAVGHGKLLGEIEPPITLPSHS